MSLGKRLENVKLRFACAWAHLSFLLGAWAASGTGVPPVCSKPETHGRDTRATNIDIAKKDAPVRV